MKKLQQILIAAFIMISGSQQFFASQNSYEDQQALRNETYVKQDQTALGQDDATCAADNCNEIMMQEPIELFSVTSTQRFSEPTDFQDNDVPTNIDEISDIHTLEFRTSLPSLPTKPAYKKVKMPLIKFKPALEFNKMSRMIGYYNPIKKRARIESQAVKNPLPNVRYAHYPTVKFKNVIQVGPNVRFKLAEGFVLIGTYTDQNGTYITLYGKQI